MTIHEIYYNNEISLRTYNVCRYNKLDSTEKLIYYFNTNKTFNNLHKIGRKSNEELINVCKKHNNTNIITNNIDDPIIIENLNSIDEIYKNKEISIRTYNICRQNNLESTDKIMEYYIKHKTFINLKKVGRRTNEELKIICKKYISARLEIKNIEIKNIEIKKIKELKQKLQNLTSIQRKLICNFIEFNTNNLSVRSKNAISNLLDNKINLENISEQILLSETFDLNKINNIGTKCTPEILKYISNIRIFIDFVGQSTDENKIRKIQNKILIQQSYSLSNVPDEIIENESIFELTNILLKYNVLYKNNQENIIINSLKLFNRDRYLTLDEIGIENNITKERVRQIRNKFLGNLDENLMIIKLFKDNLLINYDIDINKCLIKINEELKNKINYKFKTNFTKEFISHILSVYLNGDYSFIGINKSVLIPKFNYSQNNHEWNNLYLICNKINNIFNFTKFINNVNERLNDRIEQSYSFNFKSYLSKFVEEINIDTLELVFPIAEKIINDEFGLHLDDEDNIIFNSNTLKQAHQYAYEALEHLGKPSKVNEIYVKINELYPNYITDSNKVRASMKRKDGFVPVGKNSIFGLKKWENEIEDFKGGTIRSITIEYLKQFDQPKHISNISKYVLKYRPKSNEKSIYYNLKAEEHHTFEFFTNQLVGLKNKKYDDKFEIFKLSTERKQKSWEHSYKELNLFISTKQRLPSSVSTSDNEIKLYRWLYLQRKKIKNGELENKKKTLIKNTLIKFKFILKIISNNKLQINNYLTNFSLVKQNIPKNKKKGEYAFCQTVSNHNKIYKQKFNLKKNYYLQQNY